MASEVCSHAENPFRQWSVYTIPNIGVSTFALLPSENWDAIPVLGTSVFPVRLCPRKSAEGKDEPRDYEPRLTGFLPPPKNVRFSLWITATQGNRPVLMES